MSTTLFYHILGVRGYRLVKEKIVTGGMEFHIALDRSKVCCPECGSSNVWLKGSQERKFRSIPFGRTKSKKRGSG